jgi:hypothetical protein
LTVTCDAADYFNSSPASIISRPETLWVISLAQLQKLATGVRFATAFTYGMDIFRFMDALHEFTKRYRLKIVVKHLENIFVAVDGEISSTRLTTEMQVWRLKTASHASVWWLQNPSKPFESLATAVYEVAGGH